MRIGIDARPLVGRRAGIGHYLNGVLRALAPLTDHEVILYAHRPIDAPPLGHHWRMNVRPGPRGTGPLWLQLFGPSLIAHDRLDVFWGAHFLLPVALGSDIPAAVTVYDLVPVLFPQTMEWPNYAVLRLFLRPSLRRAQRVMTISQAVADDLQRLMGVPPGRIAVIPPGVRDGFVPLDPEEARRHVRDRWGLPGPYLLTVGTIEPRKNLPILLRAYGRLPTAFRARHPLVVVGASGWNTREVSALGAPFVEEGTLRFVGYVPDAEMPWLFAAASLFVYPSLYEGFGIPVLEAMASGLPIVASDIPVLREVAEGAAVYAPPGAAASWTSAIERVLADPALQAAMRDAGIKRAASYSFGRAARQVLAVLEQLGARR